VERDCGGTSAFSLRAPVPCLLVCTHLTGIVEVVNSWQIPFRAARTYELFWCVHATKWKGTAKAGGGKKIDRCIKILESVKTV